MIRYLAITALALCVGCATLKETAALRRVEFRFDAVSDPTLAGIRVDRIRAYRDLRATDVARLGFAVAAKNAPLDLTIHIEGRNPETNRVTARLIAMDWTYVVDDREILEGRLERALSFPPGEGVDIPVAIRFNLYRFFAGDARSVFDTALALAGQDGGNHAISLRVTPTIDTPLGPIRYPTPITIRLSGEGPP